MTIRRCDFCGEVIPDQTGNSVTLADIERMEAKLDGCDACIQLLWRIVKGKSLRRLLGPNSDTTVRLTETKAPERSRFHEWKYEESSMVCMNCGASKTQDPQSWSLEGWCPGAGAVPPEVSPI
jgi:hypothetical protein